MIMMTKNKILAYIDEQEKAKKLCHERLMKAIDEDNTDNASKNMSYRQRIQERIDTATKILNG